MATASADTNKPPPQFPLGTSSTLRGISENFTFHSSPEAFIASRIAQLQKDQDQVSSLSERPPIRAKILNRDVAILSSYAQIRQVLDGERGSDGPGDSEGHAPAYVAREAYRELMEEFFPPPNLLLADGEAHGRMRGAWERRMEEMRTPPSAGSSDLVGSGLSKQISSILSSMFNTSSPAPSTSIPINTLVDLYETMKTLSWRILLGVFLGLSELPDSSPEDRQLFTRIQKHHEALLRGQFSLMPIGINAGIWRSPRTKGVKSRKRLQELIGERLREDRGGGGGGCPFAKMEDAVSMEETRDHVLMATSSLAVKGLASLLTAFLLNLFLFERGGVKILDELRSLTGEEQDRSRRRYLRSICLETERLSPPIVGVMRRATREMVVTGNGAEADTILPKGWDVWIYVAGGGRDPAVFGETCDSFEPQRYTNDDIPEPLGFSVGPKSCLGKHFVRDTVLQVADHFLQNGTSIEGEVLNSGVKAWLGWEVASPEQWAKDMKQLPTQHPASPVMVEFVK